MTKLERAARQALETLISEYDQPPINVPVIEELRQAIAEAEKREWVGLTKEEVDSWELPDSPTVFEFVQFIEAKLKEKNT